MRAFDFRPQLPRDRAGSQAVQARVRATLPAGGPCVLSVSEKAIAVVDVVSAAVLAWYPLAPPRS